MYTIEKQYNDQINNYNLGVENISPEIDITPYKEFINDIRKEKKKLDDDLNEMLNKSTSQGDLIKSWDLYLVGVEGLAAKVRTNS
ncbi:MAG: hypothetical protein H0X29_06920 [Parachlamydiaceae bacterium]|nr:hypothetical protein [Parachlamydiaceae bacterium]